MRWRNFKIACGNRRLAGVGSYAAEAIARAGVGELTLVDCDMVSVTNINRQLCALTSTVGLPKAEVTARRVADINPNAVVHSLALFYEPETVKCSFPQGLIISLMPLTQCRQRPT